jgi:hypothetical protein
LSVGLRAAVVSFVNEHMVILFELNFYLFGLAVVRSTLAAGLARSWLGSEQ